MSYKPIRTSKIKSVKEDCPKISETIEKVRDTEKKKKTGLKPPQPITLNLISYNRSGYEFFQVYGVKKCFILRKN